MTGRPIQPTPAPTSHPSHVGYSTSSSPLVESSSVTESPHALPVDTSTLNPSTAPNPTASSASDHSSSSLVDLAPRHAATLGAQPSEKSLGTSATAAAKSGGAISPSTRIKNMFTSGSGKIEESTPTSPDRAYEKSTGSRNIPGVVSPSGKDMRGSNSVNDPSSPQIPDSAVIKPPRSKINGSTVTISRAVPSLIVAPKTPPSTTINAPQTTVTPPTPTDGRAEIRNGISAKSWAPLPAGIDPNVTVSASGNMISHRRVRSDSATQLPSKLSHAISAPLTPTIEESRTPGVRTPLSQNPSGSTGGFFSSVFSLAQNATSTLTNSLANSAPKAKTSAPAPGEGATGEAEKPADAPSEDGTAPVQKNKLAIDTLGSGDLTLNQLGIVTEAPMSAGFAAESFPTVADGLSEKPTGPVLRRDEAANRAEDGSVARAAPSANIEKPQNEKKGVAGAEEPSLRTGPTPAYEASISGEKTPPNGSLFEGDQGIRRSGSVRSRVGAVTRRHRNSSSATGNTVGTIGTLNGASQTTLGNANASTPKLTGFAVASKKRNRDFHQLFKSIPEDDYLIEDYSCALQREIILAGRIYVSERHICFSSNILGWVTTVIISFDEIVSVEKENTAMVFPNAIAIQTLHARQTFRSLLSREATYELLIGIWRLSHPGLKSSLNGVHLDAGGTGDKTEKVESTASDNPGDISEEEEEEVYDEDEVDEEGSLIEAADVSVQGSEDNDYVTRTSVRKASAIGVAAGSAAGGVPTSGDAKGAEKAAAAAAASVDFPGPATHAPTECTDADTHYDKVVKDEIIPAPLGKVYSMMFGPASGGFMTRWFIDDQKMMDLHMEDDKRGLGEQIRTRSYSYIKPLYSSIGPKQTKCLITETLDHIDLERAVSVTVVTQTPDVPSGHLFSTRTKFCLSWAPGNSTRLVVNCMIEWTGKSWLKGTDIKSLLKCKDVANLFAGPIEKGANDGQATYATDLVRALKAGVKARPRSGTTSSRPKTKGKRKKHEVETSSRTVLEERTVEPSLAKQSNRWGVLESVREILEPAVDIVKPLIGANLVIGILVLLQVFTWLRGGPRVHSPQVGFPQMLPPERIATYEQIWRREESQVWDWLEERIGMEKSIYSSLGSADADESDESDSAAVRKARRQREQSWKDREMQNKRWEEGTTMTEKEFAAAIRATEKRLEGLKSAIQKKRRKLGSDGGGGGRTHDEI